MGDCPWLNRTPCPSYDSKKKARVQSWTEAIEHSHSPPSTVVSVAQASLVSDATFTTFGAGVKKPMPEGCWPEWLDGAALGVWDPERDGLDALGAERRRSDGSRTDSKSGSERVEEVTSRRKGQRERVQQGDLRCDKTLPSLPPPTRALTHSSNHTVTPLPTPELTLAATQTTSRPSSQPLQSRPQSQPMADRLAPPDLPRRHSGSNENEWPYLKPTRNSLALRPASFVTEPAAARPKSSKPASLKVPYQQLPSNPSLKPKDQEHRVKSLRPTSVKPSSIKTVPAMKKRKPISLRSEDLVAIPDRSSKSTSKPRLSSKPKHDARHRPDRSSKYHPLLYESHRETTRPTSKPSRTLTEARPREEVRPPRLVDEEAARLEHISRLMAELEVESSEDEVQQLLAEFRRVRRHQRPVTEAPA